MKTLVIKPIPFPAQGVHELFTPLSHRPWSMLLESGDDKHIDSRYHILVSDPVATLLTRQGQTRIEHADGVTVSDTDPFALLQEYSETILGNIPDEQSELPFLGGALGYFGYDLGRQIENLPVLATEDLSFADMAVGLYDWAIVVDQKNQQAWQVQYSEDAETRWQQRRQWLADINVNAAATQTSSPTFALTGDWQANMTEAEYGSKFEKIQEYLRSGDCYQINLTQRFNNHYQGDEWQAYRRLSQHNRAPFSAFIRLAEQCILSISPERFIQVKADNIIETKPIKGTRPRSPEPEIDQANAEALRTATKDRAENLMIVDLLRNDIGKIAVPGSVQVPKLFDIESFPAVHHLVSTITGKLPGTKTPAELLRACFPGGSITGAPKIRAMEIIEELEPHRRSLYCGSVGYLSVHGQMDTSITIRTLLCEDNQIYCWAGGGIIADSDVTQEYQETFDKLGKILPIL